MWAADLYGFLDYVDYPQHEKDELPRSVGTQYATGDQWRNNSRKNEGMESKQKQNPAADVTRDRSKFQCSKEQCCIGTWNVRRGWQPACKGEQSIPSRHRDYVSHDPWNTPFLSFLFLSSFSSLKITHLLKWLHKPISASFVNGFIWSLVVCINWYQLENLHSSI